jgi:hypothetical protein
MPFVDAYEQSILNYIFRDLALPLPATQWFIGLFTTPPDEAGAGFVEVSGGAYARQAVTRSPTGSAQFAAATGTAPAMTSNTPAIDFPTATASWGTVTHFGIFETVGGAELRFFAELRSGGAPAPKAIGVDDTASFAGGALQVRAGKEGDDLTP